MTEEGFDRPNYTQIPNELLDRLMAEMVGSELKVTLAICRKTFGWHKEHDVISLSQLQAMTGLTRQAVLDGLVRGLKRGTIKRHKAGTQSYSYEIILKDVDITSLKSRPVEHSTSLKSRPVTSLKSRHTKETTKETLQGATPYMLFEAWCRSQGYESDKVTTTIKAKECRYAKELLRAGWVPEDVVGCLDDMKADKFWSDKQISLASVAKEINEWKRKRSTKRSIAM